MMLITDFSYNLYKSQHYLFMVRIATVSLFILETYIHSLIQCVLRAILWATVAYTKFIFHG